MRRALQKGTVIALVLAIAAVFTISGIWYHETRNLIETIELVGHTRDVLQELESLASVVGDATLRVRDYANTGNDADVNAYEAAQAMVSNHIQRVRALTADNAKQQQQLAVVERELAGRAELMKQVIDARKQEGSANAERLLQAALSPEKTQAFRNDLQLMRQTEEQLLNSRAEAAAGSSNRMLSLIALFAAVALAFFALFAYFLQRDSRARNRAEEALIESEEHTRSILEQAHTAYIEIDSLGSVVAWNRQAETVFGWTQAEAISQRLSEMIIPSAYRLSHENGLKRFLKTGQGRILNQVLRMRALHKDGHEFPLEFTISTIFCRGRHTFSAFLQDITERERAEEALRESEERHRVVFDSSPVPMWINDLTTLRFLAVNKAAQHHYGYTDSEFSAMTIKDVVVPEGVPALLERVGQVTTGMERVISARHRKKDGSVIDVEVRIHGMTLGEKRASLALVTDVTERQRADMELREAHANLTTSVEKLEQREKELLRLGEMGDLLQSCRSAHEAYDAVARYLPQLFPGCLGALSAINASRNLVEAQALWGGGTFRDKDSCFAPDDCWALRRGRIHVVEPQGTAPECNHFRLSESAFHVCVPMMAQSDALGVLHLDIPADGTSHSAPRGEDFRASQVRLATTAAEQIALAIANLKLRDTLQNQSIRDPLTNLYNRRYMEECLQRELHRAIRSQGPLAVILVDIDHFKRFNDSFGHEVGDEMLCMVARFLKDSIRAEDIACRYGGEEFVLVLSNSTPEGAQQRAEQLCYGVRQLKLQLRDQAVGTVTLSLGVASFPNHGSSPELLLRIADRALYRAKEEGRDRAVMGEALQLDRT